MKRSLLTGLAAGWLALPMTAGADTPDDLQTLKRELAALKASYEARIGALEARIKAADTPPPASLGHHTTPTPMAPTPSNNAFNPAVSLVLQGAVSSYRRDPAAWTLPGFQMGRESGLKQEGFSLTETELTLSANVDDWFYGQSTLGLHEEDGTSVIEVEEAYLDTLSLPAGLAMRMGRFFSETGYLNTRHPHVWDFADAPLTSQAFLGKQYGDDGVRLTWLAPTDTYIQLGAELLAGKKFPGGGDNRRLLGDNRNLFVRVGSDIGRHQSVRIGLSHLRGSPTDRRSGDPHAEGGNEIFSFDGDSKLTAIDLVYKYQPSNRRGFVLQGEYFHRDEDGVINFSNAIGGALLPYAGTQQGFYVQGVLALQPRWRVGLRYDRLWSDNRLAVRNNTSGESGATLLDESNLLGDHDPYRWTLMTDYSRSDFSRIRLQYARDYSRPGAADDQFQLQYIMTLGAHGAHQY